MALVLYRIGRWAFAHRWTTLGIWLAVLIAVAAGAVTLKGQTSDSFSIPGTQSQKALDLLNNTFPGTGGATARIVIAAPAGHTLSERQYRKVLAPTVALASRVPQAASNAEAFRQSVVVSRDHRIAFADLHFTVPVDKLSDQTKAALQRVAQPARNAGLEVEFSGGIISTSSGGSGGASEGIGIIIAFIILAITFGALLVATFPLLTALIGVGIGLLGIQILSGFFALNSTAPALATMLGLAVGIDYALFILSRYRQHVASGLEPEESAARAVATAGSAVVFAGLTVVIALAGLSIVGIPFLSVMGLTAAGTVVVAVLIALTLLPALIGFAPKRASKGKHAINNGDSMGARWVRLVIRKPLIPIVGVIALLGVVAVPFLHIQQGLPDAGTKPKTTTERRAYDLLAKGFGPGFNGPLTIVVDASGQPNPHRVAEAVSGSLGTFPDVASASKPVFNEQGDVAIINVTPASGPSSQATRNLVASIRNAAEPASKKYGIQTLVTGPTAINIDTSSKLASALPVYLVIVVGLALILLAVVFRSILVPIKAVAGFVLTIGASLGIVVWIFQQGHLGGLFGVQEHAPIVSFLPITMVGILFGLAMDYEVFLVSRMRESYVHQGDPKTAVTEGFTSSARVVTAAALIMISVFGGFIFGSDPTIKSIGLALAAGVLIDAFLVRMTLVPAVLAISGRSAWKLPHFLRGIPNVDIEGEQLTEHLTPPQAS